MLTPIPRTYPDPDPGYEATHKPPTSATPRYPIKPVLSPGTTHRARWTTAIQALISVLGQDAVLIDSALSGYVAPYDFPEAESATDKRKVPSATVCPGFKDQLSAILKIVNKFTIPP